MSYLKEEFMAYMHDVKKSNSPGVYANSLANIERLLSIDIDKEFEKNECAALYDRLQMLRRNPEQIGKKEHDVRQYASNLKRYVEFRTWHGGERDELDKQIAEKISFIIENYKNDFKKVNEGEHYKWIAVKWYKQNWNIEATDFSAMISEAFSKAENLLTSNMYYAYKMLTLYADEYPEQVRELFKMLHNEELSLDYRYENFRKSFDTYIEILKEKKEFKEKSLQHYQDLHAISVYLYFEYPEKYYIYKAKMYTLIRDRIGYIEDKTNNKSVVCKYINHMRLCEQIRKIALEDLELIRLNQSRLEESCYPDPELHLLSMDIAFYGAIYMREDSFDTKENITLSDSYWPSYEQYNPKISEKEWELFLLDDQKDYPATIKMLKTMLDLGGEATCKKLSTLLGDHPSSWASRGNSLGQRVKKKYNLEPCMDDDKERYFPIPFLGREVVEEGKKLYSWTLRKELKAALTNMDLDVNEYDESTTDVDLNTILYGPPGTGKTYHTVIYAVSIIEKRELKEVIKERYEEVLARYNDYKDEGRIAFTTFHQSYGYEEFIEGIKPIIVRTMDNSDVRDLQYDVLPGSFKYFCSQAERGKNRDNYVFIIDEINRGNISKVFGELISLIEPSKRLGEIEEVKVLLPYSGTMFGVPKNVYLLGTMNTADRSIATIDAALRRRFHFREILPDPDVLKDIYVEDISISSILSRLNKKIEILFDREHMIGHAYFMDLKDSATIDTLGKIFENSIIPLLQEYFYDDYEKIRLILGDNKKSEENQFIVARSHDYIELFGNADFGFEEMVSYEVNKKAFTELEAYRSI